MALCARSPQAGVGLNQGPGCGWPGASHPLQASHAGAGGGGGGDAAPPARAWPPLLLPPLASPSRERAALPISPLSLRLPGPPRPDNWNTVHLEQGKIEDDEDSGEYEQDGQDQEEDYKEQLSDLVHESPDNSIIQEKMKEILRQMQDSQAEVTRLVICMEISEDKFSSLKWDKAYFLNPEEYFSSVVAEQLSDLVRESPDNSIVQEKMKEILRQMQDSQAEVTRLVECMKMSEDKFSSLKWDKAYFLNPEEYFSSVVAEQLSDLVRESPDNSIIQEKIKVFSCSAAASGSGRYSGCRNTHKSSKPKEGAALKGRRPSRAQEVEDGEEDPYPPPFLKCALCGRSLATFYQKCCATPVCNNCWCKCEEKARRKLPKVILEGTDLFLWSKTEYEALPRNPLMLVSARRDKYKLHYSFAPVHEVVDESSLVLHLTIYSFYSSATAIPPWSSRGSIDTQVVTKDSFYG